MRSKFCNWTTRLYHYNALCNHRTLLTLCGTTSTTLLYTFSATAITTTNDDEIPKKKVPLKKQSSVDRISGHYQNRIRQHSTPEKIFSTFASRTNKFGAEIMTFNDFKQAILPHDFRNIDSAKTMKGKTKKNTKEDMPEFLHSLLDPRSISLSEFMFITSLLSIPPQDFEFVFKIFDLDGNGQMDAQEFLQLLEHFRCKNTSAYDDMGIVCKTKAWKVLFGKKEDQELTLKEFETFLFGLRRSMLIIEYSRYCGKTSKNMSCKKFAMSLVSYAHHSQISYYIARVNRMPKKKFESISFDEFVDFNNMLFRINDILRALTFYKNCKEEITRQAFKHTVKCITDIELSDNMIEIMFWVFDQDGDDTLDHKEIESLLKQRFQYGQTTDRIFGAGLWNCFATCFS